MGSRIKDWGTIISPDGEEIIISDNHQHRMLRCEDCEQVWCEHIEKFILEGQDAEIMWNVIELKFEREEDLDIVEPYEMPVPIIATKNLWAECRVSPDGKMEDTFLIGIMVKDEPQFVGYLHKGEGRAVIRGMLLEFFRGSYFDDMTCENPFHNFQAEVAWQTAKKSPVDSVVEQWSVWTTGKCLTCKTNSDQEDFSDLIPEKEPKF